MLKKQFNNKDSLLDLITYILSYMITLLPVELCLEKNNNHLYFWFLNSRFCLNIKVYDFN